MRFVDGSSISGAWLSNHRVSTATVVALVIAATLATVACSGDLSTAPTTSRNVKLIAHFDSLAATAPREQSFQLIDIVTELANGAPVGNVIVELNAGMASYSYVARYDIIDVAGRPADSDLFVFAWRGADADTIVGFFYQHDTVSAALTTQDGVFLTSKLAAGAATASAPNGACTSFVSVLPPSIFIPPEVSCARERVSAVATGKLTDTTGVSVDFALPQQTLAAIRYEFNESALGQRR